MLWNKLCTGFIEILPKYDWVYQTVHNERSYITFNQVHFKLYKTLLLYFWQYSEGLKTDMLPQGPWNGTQLVYTSVLLLQELCWFFPCLVAHRTINVVDDSVIQTCWLLTKKELTTVYHCVTSLSPLLYIICLLKSGKTIVCDYYFVSGILTAFLDQISQLPLVPISSSV